MFNCPLYPCGVCAPNYGTRPPAPGFSPSPSPLTSRAPSPASCLSVLQNLPISLFIPLTCFLFLSSLPLSRSPGGSLLLSLPPPPA